MAIPLGPKQIVSFEELPMSQLVQQQALTRLLVEKGIIHGGGIFRDGVDGRTGNEKDKTNVKQ
jgi:hypothetical protein